jgi:hypothetical protein
VIFVYSGELEFSYHYVNDDGEKHNWELVKTDLIGARWLATEGASWNEF